MAPVEPNSTTNSNFIPLFSLSISIISTLTTTYKILTTISHARRTLSPASSTRLQRPARRNHVVVFSSLATLSLLLVTAFSLVWRVNSYLDWAQKGHHDVPNTLWSGWYAKDVEPIDTLRHPGYWRLGDWMRDVDLATEAEEVAIKTGEGFVWTIQRFLGVLGASVFMGVEGFRRNVPKGTIVSFVILAQFFSLAFALNLFFILVLFTPAPLQRATSRKRDPLWTPSPVLFEVTIAVASLILACAPATVNYQAWTEAPLLRYLHAFIPWMHLVVPLGLALAVEHAPLSLGKTHISRSSAHRTLITPYKCLGVISTFFFLWQLGSLQWASTPPKAYSLYDRTLHWNTVSNRTFSERLAAGLSRSLHSLSHVSRHPAIGVISSDVVITAITLLVWAFVRNVSVDGMIESSALLDHFFPSKTATHKEKHVAFDDEVEVNGDTTAVQKAAASPNKRSRGRPKKSETAAASTSASLSGTLRRSTRRRVEAEPELSHEPDGTYKPDSHTAHDVAKAEFEEGPGEENPVEGGEAAALGLAMYVVGGLGTLVSGVLGSEVIAS